MSSAALPFTPRSSARLSRRRPSLSCSSSSRPPRIPPPPTAFSSAPARPRTVMPASPSVERGAATALRLAASVLLTLFGLLLATFLIARVVPIDPVLAVVGDRASAETYQRVRIALGLHQPLYVPFLRHVGLG